MSCWTGCAGCPDCLPDREELDCRERGRSNGKPIKCFNCKRPLTSDGAIKSNTLCNGCYFNAQVSK